MHTYSIEYKGTILTVEKYDIKEQEVYLVTLDSEVMVLSRQTNLAGEIYWHAAPQKYQLIANEIVEQIQQYLQNHGEAGTF